MLSPSTMRLAAASVTIVLASTASAQRAATATLGGPTLAVATEAGAPPESMAKMLFDDPPAATELPVDPPRLALVGVLALIGSLLLTTRWRVRNTAAA